MSVRSAAVYKQPSVNVHAVYLQ